MRMRIGLLAILTLASAVRAEDDPAIRPLTWRVSADGHVLVWPDWRRQLAMEESLTPVMLYPPVWMPLANSTAELFAEDRAAMNMLDVVSQLWPALTIVALFSGPVDLASMTDAEYHYRKLRLGYHVLGVTQVRPSSNPFLLRRRKLDQILWMRVAGRHGDPFSLVKEGPGQDDITRAVAKQVNAQIAGTRSGVQRWMPAEIPAGCAVYAYLDARRIPISTRMMRLALRAHARQIRAVHRDIGAALHPWEPVMVQEWLDRLAELPYEIARTYCNLMVERAWLAGTLGPQSKGVVRLEGLVELEQLRVALQGPGAAAQEGPLRLRFCGMALRASENHAELRVGALRDGPAPADSDLVEELRRLGLGGDAAIWVHVRDTTGLPFLRTAGIERATMRASFVEGVRASATVTCRDEAEAKTLGETLTTLRAKATAAILLGEYVDEKTRKPPTAAARSLAGLVQSVEVAADGDTVEIRFHAPGETPETLFETIAEGYPPSGFE